MDEKNFAIQGKRKVEEYSDPDYVSSDAKRFCDGIPKDGDRLNRIRNVVISEFKKEIKAKQSMINLVEQKIHETQKFIDELRYAIAFEYFKKDDLHLNDHSNKDNNLGGTDNKNKSVSLSTPNHPSIKISLEKNQNPICQSEEQRQLPLEPSKKRCTSSDEKQSFLNEANDRLQIPLENPKFSPKCKNRSKYLFVAGNTSKYVGIIDEKNAASHLRPMFKWIAYIQCKNCNINTENILKMVRFYLHPSYKPNDILEIVSPPFQIVQRGWGEFPLRIELFFNDSLKQKPIQIVHNIVLDRSLSGMHTLGAETIFEVWLPSKHLFASSNNENLDESKDLPKTNIEEIVKTRQKSNGSQHLTVKESKSPKKIPLVESEKPSDEVSYIKTEYRNSIELKEIKKEDNQHSEPMVLSKTNTPSINDECVKTDGSNRLDMLSDCSNADLKLVKPPTNNVMKQMDKKNDALLSDNTNKNFVFQKAGKLYIIDPLQMKIKQDRRSQVSLLKVKRLAPTRDLQGTQKYPKYLEGHSRGSNVSQREGEFDERTLCVLMDHDYFQIPDYNSTNISKKKYPRKPPTISNQEIRTELVKKFRRIFLKDLNGFLDKLLELFPIIKTSKEYKGSFPFMVESHEEFMKCPPAKQRVLEWLRARHLKKLLSLYRQLKTVSVIREDSFWTTREIVIYARHGGWTPRLSEFTQKFTRFDEDLRLGEIFKLESNPTTVTSNVCVKNEISLFSKELQKIKEKHSEDETICIENTNELELKPKLHPPTHFLIPSYPNEVLKPPDHLQNHLQILRSILSEQNTKVKSLEGSSPDIMCSEVEILFAQCLHSFIEKIIRHSLAGNLEKSEKNFTNERSGFSLNPRNIQEGILTLEEFDFLSNVGLGT